MSVLKQMLRQDSRKGSKVANIERCAATNFMVETLERCQDKLSQEMQKCLRPRDETIFKAERCNNMLGKIEVQGLNLMRRKNLTAHLEILNVYANKNNQCW